MDVHIGREGGKCKSKKTKEYVLQRQQNKSNDSNQKLKMLQNNEDFTQRKYHIKYHYDNI